MAASRWIRSGTRPFGPRQMGMALGARGGGVVCGRLASHNKGECQRGYVKGATLNLGPDPTV